MWAVQQAAICIASLLKVPLYAEDNVAISRRTLGHETILWAGVADCHLFNDVKTSVGLVRGRDLQAIAMRLLGEQDNGPLANFRECAR